MRFIALLLIAAFLAGCATTFVPISWGMREEVLHLSKHDSVLNILFKKYDPERKTLRVDGPSFDVVGESHDTWKYEGAYVPEQKLIYRNSEVALDGQNLRNVILHEMAHHIWFNFMNREQKKNWLEHLHENPSEWQKMVRRVYANAKNHDAEDFAYTVEFARTHDLQALVELNIITADEMMQWKQVNKQLGINGKHLRPALAEK